MTEQIGAVVDQDAPTAEASDEALAARVAQRDVAAFSLLFDRYAQIIYVFAGHTLGTTDAEELDDASVAPMQSEGGEPVAPGAAAPQSPVPAPPERGELSGSLRIPRGRRWPVWRRLPMVGALAAVLIVLLALGWSVQLSAALARERALRAEYAQLVSQQQELVIDILDSPKTVKAVLRPT
jgi:hypothetical protein